METVQGCPAAESGASDGGGSSAASQADAASCRMAALLEQNCQSCHAATPLAGAPMPLMTWHDLMAPAHSDPSRRVYELVRQRINATSNFMPPVGHLSASQLAVVDAWMNAGEPDCGFGAASTATGSGSAEDADGGEPDVQLIEPDHCYELRAHGAQTPDDTTPFGVAPKEFYHDFNFRTPYDKPISGLTFTTLIDNAKVVHHWLLYEVDDSSIADGSHADGNGTHTNGKLLFGWAPGGQLPTMPPGVGFAMPAPGARLQLEFHYYNTTGTQQPDRSGVKFCVTSKPMPYTATTTTLGAEGIVILPAKSGVASGTCTPGFLQGTDKRDIHILFSSPHMHKTGTHMKTVINRADGSHDTLIDKPFSFLEQHSYPTPALVHPGDTLTTTCDYENMSATLVTYGPSTTQEMCYNFIVAYPADLLANPGGSLQGSKNTCLR